MTTTIKVADELRDRLKEQAARKGMTLGAHLTALADLADRERRLALLREAVAATPLESIQNYRDETSGWETTELADAGQ